MKTTTSKRPQKSKGPQRSWKRALIVVVAALVVISLGRSLIPLGGSGPSPLNITGGGREGTTTKEPPAQQPTKIVQFNGKKVPIGEGPVAVLNPGLARPGGKVGVNGSGFDPGARVNVMLSSGKGRATIMATKKANKYGVIDAEFTYPVGAGNSGKKQSVTLAQVGSTKKVAKAELVAQAGVGLVELSDQVGKPGTPLTVDADGFLPNEKINVFWGRLTGTPSQVLRADPDGKLQHESLRVGVGAVGDNTVILMGAKSKTTAMAPFQLLRQYPMVLTKPFSARATETIHVTGKGFAPNERVLGYLGQAGGMPVMTVRADEDGSIGNIAFKVPFDLKGRQTLIFTGEQSRASAKAGFLAQQYMPVVRGSTWGGLPGTVMNFYAKGFAPNEAVHVYVGDELVSAFRVDSKGKAVAAGKYMIPSDVEKSVEFQMIGARSGGVGKLSVKVDKSEGMVQIPKQPKYKLPKDLRR
ncbi:hypothetical protein ABN028_11870 [Actinopolymorpha sp. B17G11]|uniref:hypothetical protein n=1 Tax=unclassified Actinopolymorpha TaxID=2627063 RepID=UPI0032E44321